MNISSPWKGRQNASLSPCIAVPEKEKLVNSVGLIVGVLEVGFWKDSLMFSVASLRSVSFWQSSNFVSRCDVISCSTFFSFSFLGVCSFSDFIDFFAKCQVTIISHAIVINKKLNLKK